MRSALVLFACAMVVMFATWAYRVNYDTREAVQRVTDLQFAIAREREALGVLRAEWAYLNRPDRLRELAEEHFAELRLMPMQPSSFAEAAEVAFPEPSLEDAIAEALLAMNAVPPATDEAFR